MQSMIKISKFDFKIFWQMSRVKKKFVIWFFSFFSKAYIQSFRSNSRIKICMKMKNPNSSRRNWIWKLYTFRKIIIAFVIVGSSIRITTKIFDGTVWMINWRIISLRMFEIIARRFKIECASKTLLKWLCFEFIIFKFHGFISLSSSIFAIRKNEHSTCLLMLCRLCWSREMRIFFFDRI